MRKKHVNIPLCRLSEFRRVLHWLGIIKPQSSSNVSMIRKQNPCVVRVLHAGMDRYGIWWSKYGANNIRAERRYVSK